MLRLARAHPGAHSPARAGALRGHAALPQGLFVLARVVDERVAIINGIARGNFAQDLRVVAGADGVHDPAVEVSEAVQEERRAAGGQAIGHAEELVMVLAAGLREMGSGVYLVVAQDAQGEGGALEDQVVRVTVIAFDWRPRLVPST